jgi:hypothetical protein
MDDRKVRATVSAFRQHVPNPQQSDIAELVAVLQDYVTSRPQNETRGRRRATSGGRAAASKTAAAVASLNRSSSLPPLSPHRGSETTPQGGKTPVFCFGPHAFLCLPPSLFRLPLSLVFSRAHTPACTHTHKHKRTQSQWATSARTTGIGLRWSGTPVTCGPTCVSVSLSPSSCL